MAKKTRYVVENEKREVVYEGVDGTDIVQTAKELLFSGKERGVCAVVIDPEGKRTRKYTACEGFVMPQQHEKT